MTTPLAILNNNPLNIRYNSKNKWIGLVGSNKGFCVFSSLELGYRAAIVLLCNYHRSGYDTIRKIVGRWAPASENNVEAYIHYVCNLFASPARDADARLDFNDLCKLAYRMSIYEIGADYVKFLNAHKSPINPFESYQKAVSGYKYNFNPVPVCASIQFV